MSLETRLSAFADRVADEFNAVRSALTSGLAGKVGTGDSRLSDARTPTAHKTTHAAGGTDALSPTDIGAAASTHSHAESDVTNLVTDLAGKQPLDSDLTAIAALTPTNDDVVQRKAGAWTNRTMAQVKTDLALTKSDVGLSNVDNTADTAKPVSTAQQTALNAKQDTSAKGAASGYASLDGSTKVPIAQLPTGSTGSTVAIGNDARLSDARTPTAHKSTHATGGTDALSPSDIGAQPVDSDLTTIAGLTATTDNFLQAKASAWASRTPTQVAADLVTPLSSSLQATSAKGAASGYASLDGSTKVPIAQLPTGTSSTTVAIGNDSRLSDARTPTGAAGGALSGTYPNPSLNVVSWAPVTVTYAATLNIDASLGNSFKVTATGAVALAVPSNGTDGQTIMIEVLASGAARTVTLNASIQMVSTQAGPLVIATGEVGFVMLRYSALAGNVWVCLALDQTV